MKKRVYLMLPWMLLAGCQPLSFPDPGAMEAAASDGSRAFGKAAPGFTLPDQEGRPISLEGLRGKWVVLYFYPADDTPGCTCEATDFTRLLASLRGAGAEVIAISPDTPAVHRVFREKYHLGLTLLSDPEHGVMQAYGAWLEHPLAGPRVLRQTFIIAPDGTIAWHWPEVAPVGHAERVAERLRLLQRQAAATRRRA